MDFEKVKLFMKYYFPDKAIHVAKHALKDPIVFLQSRIPEVLTSEKPVKTVCNLTIVKLILII